MYQRGLGHMCVHARAPMPSGHSYHLGPSAERRGSPWFTTRRSMTDPFTGATPIIPAEDSRRSLAALDFPTTGITLSAVFSPAAVSGNLCQFKNERRDRGLQYITDAMLPIGCDRSRRPRSSSQKNPQGRTIQQLPDGAAQRRAARALTFPGST